MVARNLREIIPAFFVGPGGQPLTEEQARTRQELAESLLSQATDTSPTAGGWTSVLAKGVQGLAAGRQRNRAEEGLRLAGERDADLSRSLLSGASLGSTAPASSLPLGAAPVGAVASQPLDPISQRVSDAHTGGVSPDVVRSGLVQRGLPAHVAEAFVVNFQDESGLNPGINEIAPIVPGSRGGYGLYQLTGPRRVAYEQFAQERGVPLDSVDAQLDFLVQELQGPEARAAQRILSAPDTATAAQAIVTDFLRPAPEHRSRRVSQYAGLPNFTAPAQTDDIATMLAYGPQGDGDGGPLAAAPFESAGLPVAPVAEDVIVATTPEEVLAAEMATGMIPDPLSLPENQITMDYVEPQGGAYVDPVVAAAPVGGLTGQVAPNDPGPWGMGIDPNDPSTIPAMAGGTRDVITALDPAMGYFPPAPSASRGAFPPAPTAQAAASSPPPTGGGASVGGVNPAIIEALSSPYASTQTKQIAGMLLEQQMGEQRAIQDRVIAEQQAAAERERLRQIAQSSGINPIYAEDPELWKQAAQAQFNQPTDVREYEYALGQGYQGSFADFQRDMKKAGATTVDARNMGNIPQGYRVVYDEAGNPVQMEPIPGGPADTTSQDAQKVEQTQTWNRIVNQEIGRALDIIESSGLPTTGAVGDILSGVGGTGARDLRGLLDTIKSNAGFDRLQAMRDSSPTGGALGQVSERELAFLQSTIGNLEQSQSREQLEFNLRRLQRLYQNMLEGRRAYDGLIDEPEDAAITGRDLPEPKSKAEMDALPSGTRFRAPDGSIRIKP